MRLVSAARHADLQYRYERMTEARETAEMLAEERLCAIVRLCAEIDQLRDKHPDGPVSAPRTQAGDAELRRQLHLARRALIELDARITSCRRRMSRTRGSCTTCGRG